MLRFGPDTGPVVIAALPLFEEANRTRAFVVTVLRKLAERGVASILPDLPGTGDSLSPLERLSILDLQTAYDDCLAVPVAEGRTSYAFGVRSGALLDALGLLSGRWHLTPQDGSQLLRELTRIKQAELHRSTPLGDAWYFDDAPLDDTSAPPVRIAGNLISPILLIDLTVKKPLNSEDIPRRVARLGTDAQPADIKFDAAPLWRRAEPDNDPALAALIADDIAAWIAKCEG